MVADSTSPNSDSFPSDDGRLAFAVDAAEVGLFSLEDAALTANCSFRLHFGLPSEGAISESDLLGNLLPESAARLSAALAVTLARGAPLDLVLTTRDGERPVRPVRVVRVVGRLSPRGNAVEGASIDRTELSASEETLRRTSAELAATAAELEQFAYSASHDLQEPLRMVTNYLSLLERRYAEQLDDRAREYIRFAVDGGSRMQRLIKDLLAFSRAGRDREPEEPVPLEEAVRTALRGLAPEIAEAEATIRVPELPVVLGHRSQLVALFQNLVGNAVKYRGAAPPVVTISAAPGPKEWTFDVVDAGIGIDPEYREVVFEPFRRLHPRDVFPGTGLGLSICRKVVARYGGTIRAESAPDGPGARIVFTIPSVRIPESHPPESP